MSTEQRTAVVIGTGTIGLGWISLFLGQGLRVRVCSRRPDARRVVAEAIELHAPFLPPGSADPADLAARLEFEPDVRRAVEGADVVQENVPEQLELKQELFGRIGEAAAPETLLLSSTSTLLPDAIGARMGDSARLVVGHPFNPPHVVPLVEVVGGERTHPEAVAEAVAFYRSVGKVPIVLRKPIHAFVANRLQSALLQESVHLVREGVVTLSELDAVVTNSIGLRWATVGPFHAFHLGGGQGGLRHWLSSLGANLEAGWRGLGRPPMDEETLELLLEQADKAFGGSSYEELVRARDRRQTAVLGALAEVEAAEA
ncbi:3-hydroxyacyl-CoA dehydrogenase NAD-binding domain-containing protein [Actinocorallia sp. API 0066]|uniref:3-hydroxyacyl-CoA dehydrogenase NAD-binding domain-containing protein n=1 Tax=Actinocorallia sp. API 0066 TaxID=2896846 RepID=UPI001E63825F|nr:3-hydroxyacyl-CoA dehydrogenase NAD-binding domain-containing protein [Actinocorallia sp. API 0066]MCD0452126.1 3-hydroxyacyl-CoA dehydrogenase NAD-binding domain-containing protein [Actinocorallia sp. API 0066]